MIVLRPGHPRSGLAKADGLIGEGHRLVLLEWFQWDHGQIRDPSGASLGLDGFVRARKPKRLPVVLTREEVRQVLSRLSGAQALVVTLLYGSGLRLLEGLRLRVHDVDFERSLVVVRDGKGRRDRAALLPTRVRTPLRVHLDQVKALHLRDLRSGAGSVWLPEALARKIPGAPRQW